MPLSRNELHEQKNNYKMAVAVSPPSPTKQVTNILTWLFYQSITALNNPFMGKAGDQI